MTSTKASFSSTEPTSTSSRSSSSSKPSISTLQLKPWYIPTIDDISPSMRTLLEEYSHIPSASVIPHVLSIRDKAYTTSPTPFLGLLTFTTPSLPLSPSYPLILDTLSTSPHSKLLDIGTGLGQDLRSLSFAGVPSSSLYGIDTSTTLVNLSHDLFDDHSSFRGKLITGDILSWNDIQKWEHQFTFVNLSLFLHLFDYERQVDVLVNVVKLLKKESGVLVTGTLVGNELGGREVVSVVRGGEKRSWRHDIRSFEALWEEVGRRAGGEWMVRAWFEGDGNGEGKEWDEEGTRGVRFEVKRG